MKLTPKKKLTKPIFIVGHARGGSTLLAQLVVKHSQVGPKHRIAQLETDSIEKFKNHIEFSEFLEQKKIWFKYFKGEECFTHMGKEIYQEKLLLDTGQINTLIDELTENFKEQRFISKAPTNVFRLNVIRELFPDAKIIVILRRGEEVVASWGQRSYGFGKRVNWGSTKIDKLSFYKGINIFSRKWYEVIEAVEDFNKCDNVLTISYNGLMDKTFETLQKVFSYLELPMEDYVYDIKLNHDKSKWKKKIPFLMRNYLKLKVFKGNRRINRLIN